MDSSRVVDRIEKADDVNRLVKGIYATRLQEKNYILRGDAKYSDLVDSSVTDLLAQATEEKNYIIRANDANRLKVERLIADIHQLAGATTANRFYPLGP